MSSASRIAVVGAGYVGLCTAVAFARLGHTVHLCDVDPRRIQTIAGGKAPFHEPGLDDAIAEALASGRLLVGTDTAAAAAASRMTFLAVGTPPGEGGHPNLTYLREAAKQAAQGAKSGGAAGPHVFVTKSTVPPGTTNAVVEPAVAGILGTGNFRLASNPEFLREGSALADALKPDRIVAGADDAATLDAVLGLYDGIDAPRVRVRLRTAETIKYAANAFLAVRVSLVNEMANLCEAAGVDWPEVASGIGHDARIGSQFLRAGVGFGGSCLPKDLAGLRLFADTLKVDTPVLDAAQELNDAQFGRALAILEERLKDLRGKRIALLGLSFKAGTDDVRESRAILLHHALSAAGANVVCHDPMAGPAFRNAVPRAELADSIEAALQGADAAIVQAEWPAYRDLSAAAWTGSMRRALVVDGRTVLDAARLRQGGVDCVAIGRGAR